MKVLLSLAAYQHASGLMLKTQSLKNTDEATATLPPTEGLDPRKEGYHLWTEP